MNNSFSFKRFSLLFKKHAVENYRTYLLSAFVFTCLPIAFSIFMIISNRKGLDDDNQFAIFMIFLLLGGTVFTSMIFSDLGDKRKSVAQLTLPVSNLERYAVAWIYSFLGFQLVCIISYYSIISILYFLAKSMYGDPGLYPYKSFDIINVFSDSRYNGVFFVYSILHSAAFFGSVFFNKYHFIKTAFVFILFTLFIMLINSIMIKSFIDTDVAGRFPFTDLQILNNNDWDNYIRVPESVRYITVFAALLGSILLWTGSFYKLKEQEV